MSGECFPFTIFFCLFCLSEWKIARSGTEPFQMKLSARKPNAVGKLLCTHILQEISWAAIIPVPKPQKVWKGLVENRKQLQVHQNRMFTLCSAYLWYSVISKTWVNGLLLFHVCVAIASKCTKVSLCTKMGTRVSWRNNYEPVRSLQVWALFFWHCHYIGIKDFTYKYFTLQKKE